MSICVLVFSISFENLEPFADGYPQELTASIGELQKEEKAPDFCASPYKCSKPLPMRRIKQPIHLASGPRDVPERANKVINYGTKRRRSGRQTRLDSINSRELGDSLTIKLNHDCNEPFPVPEISVANRADSPRCPVTEFARTPPPLPHQASVDKSGTTLAPKPWSWPKTVKTIETAVFIDHALDNKFAGLSGGFAELNKQVLTIMNQVIVFRRR